MRSSTCVCEQKKPAGILSFGNVSCVSPGLTQRPCIVIRRAVRPTGIVSATTTERERIAQRMGKKSERETGRIMQQSRRAKHRKKRSPLMIKHNVAQGSKQWLEAR